VERDLDESAVSISALRRLHASRQPANPPFHQQLEINLALVVLAETVGKRMTEPLDAEKIRTPLIGTIQKRAVHAMIGHRSLSAAKLLMVIGIVQRRP
jgi:hypothetical protein